MVEKLKELTLSQFAIGDDRKLEAEEMFNQIEVRLKKQTIIEKHINVDDLDIDVIQKLEKKIYELEFEIHKLELLHDERIFYLK